MHQERATAEEELFTKGAVDSSNNQATTTTSSGSGRRKDAAPDGRGVPPQESEVKKEGDEWNIRLVYRSSFEEEGEEEEKKKKQETRHSVDDDRGEGSRKMGAHHHHHHHLDRGLASRLVDHQGRGVLEQNSRVDSFTQGVRPGYERHMGSRRARGKQGGQHQESSSQGVVDVVLEDARARELRQRLRNKKEDPATHVVVPLARHPEAAPGSLPGQSSSSSPDYPKREPSFSGQASTTIASPPRNTNNNSSDQDTELKPVLTPGSTVKELMAELDLLMST